MPYEMIVPTLILFIAMIFDVRTRKIPNKLVIIGIVASLISSYYFFGFEGLKQGALAGGLAILMTLPLVLIGALGPGDMKLMFAVGLGSTYSATFSVLIFSFVWAAIVGVGLAAFHGRAQKLMQNIISILLTRTADTKNFERIPYTVPLFLAMVTFIYLGVKQGALI